MFIFNANAYARNPAGAANNIEELVKSLGGEILANRLFDERKLAYPINGHRKGVYWLTYARMESTTITKFNRACQLNDMILRHMVVKIDPRLVDAMVSVAQGKAVVPARDIPKIDDDLDEELDVEPSTEEAVVDG
jgi:small subunit ribosomal protein S6